MFSIDSRVLYRWDLSVSNAHALSCVSKIYYHCEGLSTRFDRHIVSRSSIARGIRDDWTECDFYVIFRVISYNTELLWFTHNTADYTARVRALSSKRTTCCRAVHHRAVITAAQCITRFNDRFHCARLSFISVYLCALLVNTSRNYIVWTTKRALNIYIIFP